MNRREISFQDYGVRNSSADPWCRLTEKVEGITLKSDSAFGHIARLERGEYRLFWIYRWDHGATGDANSDCFRFSGFHGFKTGTFHSIISFQERERKKY